MTKLIDSQCVLPLTINTLHLRIANTAVWGPHYTTVNGGISNKSFCTLLGLLPTSLALYV